jgi:hypothetical protein
MYNHNDFVWEEAELLARKVGRRVLRCGVRLPNDAVLGELGWMTAGQADVLTAVVLG